MSTKTDDDMTFSKIYGKCLRTLIMIRPRTCIWIFFINLYLIAKDNIS